MFTWSEYIGNCALFTSTDLFQNLPIGAGGGEGCGGLSRGRAEDALTEDETGHVCPSVHPGADCTRL